MTKNDEIDLYSAHSDAYDRLQLLRDDYRLALEASLQAAVQDIPPFKPIAIADFCGGTGLQLQQIDKLVHLHYGLVIDINREFLEIASERQLKRCRLATCCENILTAIIPREFDVVLATFAYHHVPDDDKLTFLQKARDALSSSGHLILTEIYLPDRETTREYYRKVLAEIPGGTENEPLRTFLEQTAESTAFEYKVAKEFAEAQFAKAGLRVHAEEKVWPHDQAFANNVGTFVTTLSKI